MSSPISNKTTREFYDFILNENKNISCLGFSTTPNLEFKPFDNILTSYSIYDAYCDNVILNPNIKWLKVIKFYQMKIYLVIVNMK